MSKFRPVFYYLLILCLSALTVLSTAGYEKVRSAAFVEPLPQGTVCIASQMPGRDIGAKVNACDSKLGANRGEIRLDGGGTVSTPIVISPNHTLRVVSGVYRANNPGVVIRLKDNSSLTCSSWDAVLEESTGPLGPGGVQPFTIVASYNGTSMDAPNGTASKNISVSGCHFRGARPSWDSSSQTVAMGNCHDCTVSNNWLENTRTIGIQMGGSPALGQYAQNVTISKNLLTGVASQNIAVVNAVDSSVVDNVIKAAGQEGGPGVVPIDIEPNVGDRIQNIKVIGNTIDMSRTPIDNSGAKGLHGIAINNSNGANPFTGVLVDRNTIYGAELSDPNNHVSGGLILARTASNTVISNNILRRGIYCVLLDAGSRGVTVIGNQLSTCGSGSTYPIKIEDSSSNQILNNRLWGDPANLYDFSSISKNIVETGTSNNNIYRGNDANISTKGPGSRRN
ncbi:MAG TPA: hypothetical protein VJT50_01940 [Pyrinomonadaceae bacterium]|nr:hypothetical protein [Pyrinomonadaceae bacterium]